MLHLIHPLGFTFEDRALRRAGLDYHEWTDVQQYTSFEAFMIQHAPQRLYAFSTKGRKYYTEIRYQSGDTLMFGPETRGLPTEILNGMNQDHILRLPMKTGCRSLNLSNTVAIAVYRAWADLDFYGSI